jgi:hypothetical protein
MVNILTDKRDEPLLLVTSQTLLASAGTDLLLLFCRPLILLRKLQRESKPMVQIHPTKTMFKSRQQKKCKNPDIKNQSMV